MKTPLQTKTNPVKSPACANGACLSPPSYGVSFIDSGAVQLKENKTGMSDQLKSGVESLSGIDISDVKVHYNSSQPAQLNAHAYAQGTNIHIAPGKEKYLPHEAWHVVQQKQGRVSPTKQLKGKVNINDDTTLEKEADVMGAKSLVTQHKPIYNKGAGALNDHALQHVAYRLSQPVHSPVQKAGDENVSQHFLVDEAGEAKTGQMTKNEFLDQLNNRLTQVADAELAKIHQTTHNCPYLNYWISYYKKLPAATAERGIRLYTSEALDTTNAHEVISLVVENVLANLKAQLAKSPLYPVTKANPDVLSAPGGVDQKLIPPKVTPVHSDVAQLGCGAGGDDVAEPKKGGAVVVAHDDLVMHSQSPSTADGGAAVARQQLAPQHGLIAVHDPKQFPAAISYGSTDNQAVHIAPGQKEMSAPDVQKIILDQFKASAEAKNGATQFRVGTFQFTPEEGLVRNTDPIHEDHGMEVNLTDALLEKGLVSMISGLTRSTMEAAGQWNYLVANWQHIGPTHVVAVDVDVYLDRMGNSVGFHKDSRGRTLFVNLTYGNEAPIQGPEWIRDDNEHDTGLTSSLPDKVKADINSDKHAHRGEDEIHTARLPVHGRVSFSDPSFYHSTPLGRQRIKRGDVDFTNPASYVPALQSVYRGNAQHVADATAHIQRDPAGEKADWEQSAAWPEAYNTVNTQKESGLKDPVANAISTNIRSGRTRRLSTDLAASPEFAAQLKQESAKPRAFVRTWVRLVPKEHIKDAGKQVRWIPQPVAAAAAAGVGGQNLAATNAAAKTAAASQL